MPAHQLESSIAADIRRVASVVAPWETPEVIVIDDGSRDGTRQAAETAAAEIDAVTVIGYGVNRGKGGALKEGFERTSGDTIVFLDADLSLPPEQLPEFLDTFYARGVDALVGSKRAAMAPGRYPLLRRILSRTFAGFNRVLFRLPVRETQTGLKVFRRAALEETLPRLDTDRYAFDLELLVRIHRANGSIVEAPVTLTPGASHNMAVATLWEMGRDTMTIWWKSLRWRRPQSPGSGR